MVADLKATVTAAPQIADATIAQWLRDGRFSLPREEEEPTAHTENITSRYKPSRSDVPGVAVAVTVIAVWAALAAYGLFAVRLGVTPWWQVVALTLSLEFMYTGLFITTHDAMHGTIAMRHRWLNDALGTLAISLYAWFDYGMLHKKHWEHHDHTGEVGQDPDFHRGNPHLLPWFIRFMAEYSTLWQFVRIAWWALALQVAGAPFANLLLFTTAAPLLSAFRLFYFGTYVPHHPPPGPDASTRKMGWTQSRTSSVSRWRSFLTCYHFDLHWEHHRWPYAPWWQLPHCRELSGRIAGGTHPAELAPAPAS